MAMDAAARHACGSPPRSCVAAAAAMALAVPTSAWQPPSAPATVALRLTTKPTAAAHARASRSRAPSYFSASSKASTTPGTTPAEPAVGAATMRPMDALVSSTAIASSAARASTPPASAPPRSASRASARDSPPMSPPIVRTSPSSGPYADSRITRSASSR